MKSLTSDDLENLRIPLQNLRKWHRMTIKELKTNPKYKQLHSDFCRVKAYLHCLEGEKYSHLKCLIQEVFWDVLKLKKKPRLGTLGNHFSSFMRPKYCPWGQENDPFYLDGFECASRNIKEKTVLWGEDENYSFDFKVLREGDNFSPILYISYSKRKSFPGFSKQEKEKLKKFSKSRRITICGYDHKLEKYKILYEGAPINKIKRKCGKTVKYSYTDSSLSGGILLIIFIILLGIYIGKTLITDMNIL